ncbi:hypothetical protein E2C01_039014 [Portunus trituberculatus]|uniref:Uncharacterized protein n=1 Tax=Portunus trituberculatus TaxID=210409 RepID=A0A5B7FK19_PORTR|nr:hypothetical protein [Portunus trituberculatus]
MEMGLGRGWSEERCGGGENGEGGWSVGSMGVTAGTTPTPSGATLPPWRQHARCFPTTSVTCLATNYGGRKVCGQREVVTPGGGEGYEGVEVKGAWIEGLQ